MNLYITNWYWISFSFLMYQNYLNTVKSFHSVLCQSEIFLTASSLRIVPMNLSTSCSLIRSFQFSTHGKRNLHSLKYLSNNYYKPCFQKTANFKINRSLIKSSWFRFSLPFATVWLTIWGGWGPSKQSPQASSSSWNIMRSCWLKRKSTLWEEKIRIKEEKTE